MRQRIAELETSETERQRAERALGERGKELACFYATSHDMQENLSVDELCWRVIERLVPAMQFPEITAPVIELGDRRFTSERYTEELSHGLHAGITVGGAAHGHLRVYYSEDRPFLIPEEQNLVNGIAEIVGRWLERKRAEEALNEYSQLLEEMVEERTKELREAQEELVRKEKLAVLGQLAGGVGHELRNPLGAIKNAAYFLNMVLEKPEPEVKKTLEILEKEVATSEKIISSLLGFARPKPPTRRQVDVNAILQEALSRITVPENVEVASQMDETLPTILADPDQLVQVFSNIILNGIQAMTSLSLSTELDEVSVERPKGGQLAVRTLAKSGWVAVSFTDTGVGIPEENLEKIFEPLFTTKAKGIGLGLALVKTLVERHGGTIEVQSPSAPPFDSAQDELRTGEKGKGSTFTVRLPISDFGMQNGPQSEISNTQHVSRPHLSDELKGEGM